MVAPDYHDRIFSVGTFFQLVQQHTDAVVRVGNRRKVSLGHLLEFVCLLHAQEIIGRAELQFIPRIEDIIQIVKVVLRDFHLVQGVHVEKLLGDDERQVRFGNADGHEKGFPLEIAIQLLGAPLACLVVAGFLGCRSCRTPIEFEAGLAGF